MQKSWVDKCRELRAEEINREGPQGWSAVNDDKPPLSHGHQDEIVDQSHWRKRILHEDGAGTHARLKKITKICNTL